MEMVTQIKDLVDKWLKKATTRNKVVDAVVKEQSIQVLPEEAKVWVKEHKPDTSEDAGSLAEDFRQARKKELWQPIKSTKQCNCCGRRMSLKTRRAGVERDLLHIAPSVKRRDIPQHNVARRLCSVKQDTIIFLAFLVRQLLLYIIRLGLH